MQEVFDPASPHRFFWRVDVANGILLGVNLALLFFLLLASNKEAARAPTGIPPRTAAPSALPLGNPLPKSARTKRSSGSNQSEVDDAAKAYAAENGGLTIVPWELAKLTRFKPDRRHFLGGIRIRGELGALLQISTKERETLESELRSIFEEIKAAEMQGLEIVRDEDSTYYRVGPLPDRDRLTNRIGALCIAELGPLRGEILAAIVSGETFFSMTESPVEVGVIEDASSPTGFAVSVTTRNENGVSRTQTAELLQDGIAGKFNGRYEHIVNLGAWAPYLRLQEGNSR